jgi:peptidoglycan/LPS O-acetylase OafA/YrhL
MSQVVEGGSEVLRTSLSSQPRFYRPELDGLRLYAFLGVFVCHTLPTRPSFYKSLHLPIPALWSAVVDSGANGVDLFFVLSAFLITSLLVRERQDTGGISLRLFYIRRILRIWPLYFLVVTLGIVFARWAVIPGHPWYYDQSLPKYYVGGYLLFVANWVYAACGAPASICAPLWSVSIEEQFYLVWPAAMRRLSHTGMTKAAIAIFLLAVASQVGIALSGAGKYYLYFGSMSRCDSLGLGILLALYVDRLPKLTIISRLLLLTGGLIGWIVSSQLMVRPGPVSMYMVLGRVVISLASGVILYSCLYTRTKLVTGAWVVRLGKISYGLYMLHFTGLLVVLSVLHPAHGGKLLAAKMLGLVLTAILALASYRWIESPFLRLKSHFSTVPSRPL